jgi:Uma2 family endonuclease
LRSETIGNSGKGLVGEADKRLRRNPDTSVGVDVAYVSAETARANPDDQLFREGASVLVVEILSFGQAKEITEKVQAYLDAGVKLVWVADPSFHPITVCAADAPPQLFNETHTIDTGPHLPGFRVSVRNVFAR